MDDVWGHPQLAARNRIERVDTPAGEVKAFLPPGVNNRFDHRMDPIPSIGEHTQAILRELGYADAQVAAMREQGAI
jgi:itaconate CoA-transferase